MTFSNSETLCASLWSHAVVDFGQQKVRACCKTKSIKLTSEDIKFYKKDVFLNLPSIRKSRKEMLNGGKPSVCNICWQLENTGKYSFRTGRQFWQEYFSNLNYSDYTYSYHPDNLDIQLDNLCDLKCLYCNEDFSSQWQAEKQKYGELENIVPINDDIDKFVELFFEWFLDIKENLKRIAFLGGEPLISPKFYQYLDRILDCYDGKFPENLEFNIITNLNTSPIYFNKILKTVNEYKEKIKFNINISMESYGEKAEVIRHGINFKRFTENFEELAKISGITLSTIISTNLLSLSSLHHYLKFLTDLEKKHNINIILYDNLIVYPSYLQIELLPKDLGNKFIDLSINVLQNTPHIKYINFLESLRNKFNFENLKGSEAHISLKNELEKLSSRRNINYRAIFDEYKYIWE